MRLSFTLLLASTFPAVCVSQTIFQGWHGLPGGQATSVRDAVTEYHGKLYLFGIGSTDHEHYFNVLSGSKWAGWRAIPGGGKTSLADSAIVYRDKLYLFGVG